MMTVIPIATVFTLFIVPLAYQLLARHTGSPGDVRRALEIQQKEQENHMDAGPV